MTDHKDQLTVGGEAGEGAGGGGAGTGGEVRVTSDTQVQGSGEENRGSYRDAPGNVPGPEGDEPQGADPSERHSRSG